MRKGSEKEYRGMRVRERKTNSNGEQGEMGFLNLSRDCGFRVFPLIHKNDREGYDGPEDIIL